MPEALLQDLWRRRHFDTSALHTTDGRPIGVLDPGRLNTDAGPDFNEAHVRIGGRDWHGDVEIHPASGGWFDHDHHRDARYNAAVLHVTLYVDDWTGGLIREDGSPLPEVVLAPHLTAPLRELLHDFRTREDEGLFCAPRWNEVPDQKRTRWIAEMTEERLEAKKERLVDRYFATPDLEALLHERLFAGLGYSKNDAPMSDLARRTPATAEYATDLAERFEQLEHTFDLPAPMASERWQFFRLRPANFPPLRIAQAVALVAPGGLLHRDPLGRLLDAVRSDTPARDLRAVLEANAPSDFWKTHFHLEKATAERDPSVGRRRVDTLITNAVAPILLLCAEQHGDDALASAVRALLHDLPAGSDRVTRRFRDLGTRPQDAFEAQGLHQLYRTRCCEGRCLDCTIGQHLVDPP
ncbi:MAG: DUF2851 domain-containing protein [Bacteroidetes bacterium QS_8_68_15]|nr:MAG: DUF2851 domain-containing protein [Bacteroidetes bacterium QS_8_68_15]